MSAGEPEVRVALSLVLGKDGAEEAWSVGATAGGGEGERILAAGPPGATVRAAPGAWVSVPEGLTDAEALLLPLALQMAEAVRLTGVGLGDRLLVLGEGVRGRLAALAAAGRGAETAGAGLSPVPAGTGAGPAAALVVEAGRGHEAAACAAVRRGGTVVLAAGPGGPGERFDFYRLVQQTGVRIVGVEPWPRAWEGRTLQEAAGIACRFLAAGPLLEAAPGIGTQGPYLVRWHTERSGSDAR